MCSVSSKSHSTPVFFDTKGHRRYIVSIINWTTFSIAGALLACLVITSIFSPIQPSLKVGAPARVLSSAQDERPNVKQEPSLDPDHQRIAPASVSVAATRYAHLVAWDANSFSSLKRHAGDLDVVIAEWLRLSAPNGEIAIDRDHETLVRKWQAINAPDLKIYPQVNNYSETGRRWNGVATAEMLKSTIARTSFVSAVENFAKAGAYPGIVLDFEQIPASSREDFSTLTRELSESLSKHDIKLLVQVPVGEEAYDYAALANSSNGLILMTYDESTEDGTPGPLAGQGWFEARLDDVFKLVTGDKLIVSIGSYGTDWSNTGGKEISVQEAWELLAEINTKLSFDPNALNPTFRYVDETNATQHEVWYLDGVTGYNQVAAAFAMRPEGIALWRLGTEDPSIWSAFGRGKTADEAALKDVEVLKSGYDVLYRGKGEVLNVGDAHEPGVRKLAFDAEHNLITNQEIVKHPRSTTVTRWGARDDKVIALTFDDGPDPTYTPKILDVLAEKNVKATFFVVGSSGVINSDILRRTYREGHDIGNHTFTHVNSSEVSAEYLKFELNATQRLFEASLGIRTRLFRPPYGADLEPQTIDAAEALRTSGSLNYLTIGMNIDPKDWMRPLAKQIVAKAVDGARRGQGNVMLLHDAGGVRAPTVAALPQIIDTLRAEGYRFVTIHELLGLRRDEVMTPVDPADALIAKLNFAGYSLVSAFNAFAYVLFYVGLTLSVLRLTWITAFALIQVRKEKQRADNDWRPASAAILIPTFNEEKVIVRSVRAALDCTLENMDVIVIDDGSKDRTVQVVKEVFANEPRVKIIEKPNGGKWSALNAGIAATTAEVIITIDADTLIAPDAPFLLARHFRDPKVAAVAGHAVIGNRINLITRFQALEYITNQNMDRRALEVVNGITVVPGAIGAWRREALVSIDGFAPDTLAEDSDATVRLLVDNWKVMYESAAIARTEAPETVRAFMKQRLRWMFGTLQVAYKNRSAMWRMKVVGLGFFGLPNILLFQFLLTLAAPIIDLMMLWSMISSFNSVWLSAESGTPPALVAIATYWLLFQMLEVAAATLSMYLDGRCRTWQLLPLLLVQRFFYRQLLYVTAVRVLFVALKGTMMGWGKLVRSGRVTVEPV